MHIAQAAKSRMQTVLIIIIIFTLCICRTILHLTRADNNN